MEQRSAPARPLWDRIQSACAERGWTMVRLGIESGVSRKTISNWKTQPRPPQSGSVRQVAGVLGIDLEEALRLAGVIPTPDESGAEGSEPTIAEMAARLRKLERQVREMREARDEAPSDSTARRHYG